MQMQTHDTLLLTCLPAAWAGHKLEPDDWETARLCEIEDMQISDLLLE